MPSLIIHDFTSEQLAQILEWFTGHKDAEAKCRAEILRIVRGGDTGVELEAELAEVMKLWWTAERKAGREEQKAMDLERLHAGALAEAIAELPGQPTIEQSIEGILKNHSLRSILITYTLQNDYEVEIGEGEQIIALANSTNLVAAMQKAAVIAKSDLGAKDE